MSKRYDELLRNEYDAYQAMRLASKRVDACRWMRDHAIERVDGLSHLNAIGRATDMLDDAADEWGASLLELAE